VFARCRALRRGRVCCCGRVSLSSVTLLIVAVLYNFHARTVSSIGAACVVGRVGACRRYP